MSSSIDIGNATVPDGAARATFNGAYSKDSPTADAWTRISDAVRKVDEGRIQDCKEDIDNILVFVGLWFQTLCLP